MTTTSKWRTVLAWLAAIVLAAGVHAQTAQPNDNREHLAAATYAKPHKGFWWNPLENGSGYTIDVQGDYLSLAMYLYESNGPATWYIAAMTRQADGSYAGALGRFSGGQSLSGSYRAPNGTSIGTVSLAFDTVATGTMIIQPAVGGSPRTIPIQRISMTTGQIESFAETEATFENGFWWNPNESGRGYFIEVQSSMISLASYMYDANGEPVWYLTVSHLDNDRKFTETDLLQLSNGQSLTGGYKAPGQLKSPGKLQFYATSPTTATLVIGGKQVAIQRLVFGTEPPEAPPSLAPVLPEGFFTFTPGDELTYDYWNPSTTGPSMQANRLASLPALRFVSARTELVDSIAGDGSIRFLTTASLQSYYGELFLDSDLQPLRSEGGGVICSWGSAKSSAGRGMYLGMTWDYTYARTCGTATSSAPGTYRNFGRVVSREAVTLPAGTFDAYKLEYAITNSGSNETNGNMLSTQSYTCWMSAVFGRMLACYSTVKFTYERGQVPAGYSTTQLLTGIRLENYPNKKMVPQRFAGVWRLSWTGDSSGSCTGVSVAKNLIAFFQGCSASTAPFSKNWLVGGVDDNGKLRATTPDGDVVEGVFTSSLYGAGTWRSINGQSGTWTASHPGK